ncbi:peroxisomal N(1)-acetyl-spermine/spermidine oxidase-like [Ptychodera flava]|uniref:peroxisomal N(1)-acetyl-spermine/spermidine oxidase-like n=1 Tax=Ptychodera flava TaxID=63121 RepID=UPI003969C003
MADGVMESKPTVVVVGAGLAGLAAASKLVKSNKFNVKVLEAADRAGGRVNTSWNLCLKSDDFPVEVGANWIHGTRGNPVFEFAKKHKLLKKKSFGLSFSPEGEWFNYSSEEIYFTEKGEVVSPKIVKKVAKIFKKLSKKYNAYYEGKVSLDPSVSLGEVLDKDFAEEIKKLKLSEQDQQQMLNVVEWVKKVECIDNACNSVSDISLLYFGQYEVLSGSYYTELGKGGYISVINSLLATIPETDMSLNKEVKCVHLNGVKGDNPTDHDGSNVKGQRVSIECHDGDWIDADHVLMTCSLGYLKKNSTTLFKPELPQQKAEAIRKMGFGTVDKIFLQFAKPFWDKDIEGLHFIWDVPKLSVHKRESQAAVNETEQGVDLKDSWFRKISGFEAVSDNHERVLIGWIFGKEAEYMETLDEKEVVETCVRLLGEFTGKEIPKVEKFLISRWNSNPYICGSYSHFAVGSEGSDQLNLFEPLYSVDDNNKQIPQVLFAGEATSEQFISTTHGAFSSGKREADRLINYYK